MRFLIFKNLYLRVQKYLATYKLSDDNRLSSKHAMYNTNTHKIF
jgi:hypothetical protein